MFKPKILAPAGSPETLQAVLDSGADEVYIGGKAFSARQNATNFSIEEVRQSAEKCHLYGAKLHVAVNTIVFDTQLGELVEYLKGLARAKVDALIVQDLGALSIIKAVVPEMELHASTQMTIHSLSGAMLMRELGFKRVVLSRELDRDAITEIVNLGLDTEIFVHGALCMSVSGQCYMSAMIGSRSANRGLCGQPCRLPFSACGNKNACALSLKDMSLVEYAQELASIGVTSLKIEGRMKRPEYSACAVATLKNALEGNPYDMQTLQSVFSRGGFTDGYYTGERSNMFGVRTKEDVTSAESVLPKVRESYRKVRKVSKLDFSLRLDDGVPTRLTAMDSTNSYSVSGEVPQVAINRPLDSAMAEKQVSKLGGTIYEFGELSFYNGGNLTMSASALNELRRELVSRVDCERIAMHEPSYSINDYTVQLPKNIPTDNTPKTWVRVRSFKQLVGVDLSNVDRVVMPLDSVLNQGSVPTDLVGKLVVQPPRFIVDEHVTMEKLSKVYGMGVKHLMCNNLAYIAMGSRVGYTLHGDFGLNVANSLALDSLKSLGCVDGVVSFELKLQQVEALKKSMPIGLEVYGKLPLMLVRNCPIKNEVGCKACKHYISDRTNRKFPVYCSDGYSEVFNAETVSIADRLSEVGNVDYYVLSFVDETPKEVSKVLEGFAMHKKMGTTNGLYFRGVI